MTAASDAFAKLSNSERAYLAVRVFDLLEFDADGNPGQEWNGADVCASLGEIFEQAGVKFTDPNAYDKWLYCHECATDRKVSHAADGERYECASCGEVVLCDECGAPWTDDHED